MCVCCPRPYVGGLRWYVNVYTPSLARSDAHVNHDWWRRGGGGGVSSLCLYLLGGRKTVEIEFNCKLLIENETDAFPRFSKRGSRHSIPHDLKRINWRPECGAVRCGVASDGWRAANSAIIKMYLRDATGIAYMHTHTYTHTHTQRVCV